MQPLFDFESDVEALEVAIDSLKSSESEKGTDLLTRLKDLGKDREKVLKKIYAKLNDWQVCQVARHASRPHPADYIAELFDDFTELYGDRLYADDKAIVAGLAHFNGRPVVVAGHRKGRNTDEKLQYNFGMSSPEGYRKILRMMDLAEKFSLPFICFIDTAGAYPGIGAEQRGQSGAIGNCLLRSAELQTPMLSVIAGEGGSGGALAMAAGDYVGMLQFAIYSVISPEGCASILWKDGARMADAAHLLGLTAPKLKKLGLIDEIIPEPIGGAHRDTVAAVQAVRQCLQAELSRLCNLSVDKLLEQRAKRLRNYGVFKEI